MKARHRQSGFTLLELLVAFTMLGLILVVIAGALRLGTSSWEKGEEKAEMYQRGRAALGLLTQQLKSAYPYKVKAKQAEPDYFAFQGTSDSLQFVTSFSLQSKRPVGLVFVIYRIEENPSSEKALKVCERRVLNKDFLEETPKDEDFLPFLEGLSEIRFEYFKDGEDEETPGEWVEAWDGKEEAELPRQIRVSLKWKEKKEDSETLLPAIVSLPARFYDSRGQPTKVIGTLPRRPPTKSQ